MQIFRRLLFLVLPALIILPFLSNGHTSSSSSSSSSTMKDNKTYYDVLEVDPDTCKLSDIKKAYRRLALLYHPDRVPSEKKEESTVKFREVNEAYEVLSDENQKAEYDLSLKYGGGSSSSNVGHQRYQNHAGYNMHQHHQRHHRDAFSQFDDLFRNDPFFSEAFKDMDDLFSKKFQKKNNNSHGGQQNKQKKKRGWGEWLIDALGIQVSSTSTTMNADGTSSTSTYGRSGSSSTYTSKSTRTVIENGRRITVQSMEKDGNRIEERYEGNTLVQRLVNGRPENIGRIADAEQRRQRDL